MLLCLADVQDIEASEGIGLVSDRLERILAAFKE